MQAIELASRPWFCDQEGYYPLVVWLGTGAIRVRPGSGNWRGTKPLRSDRRAKISRSEQFLSFAFAFEADRRVVFLGKAHLSAGKVGKAEGFFGLRN